METLRYWDIVRRHLAGQRGGRYPARPAGIYTQTELARCAGMPRSTLTAFLAGGECHVGTLAKMLQALGYDLVAVPRQAAESGTGQFTSSS